MRLATFNVQNMRLRRGAGRARLDGARDRDWQGPDDTALDRIDRRLTAEVIHTIDADIVALQEVFDRETLDWFHDSVLLPTGAGPYPHRICLKGNDGHGLNVALMSRRAPDAVTSHADATAAGLDLAEPPGEVAQGPLFRRDCLAVRIGALSLYVCHLKAPWPDRERARAIRRAEAEGVRRIVERAHPDPAEAEWIVLGDLNEATPHAGDALAPLRGGFAVDLMARLPPGEDWTFRTPDGAARGRPDAILLSPALARRFPDAVPRIFRAGMDPDAAARAGPRFRAVGAPRPHASDHAAVWVDLDGL
ncbi:MAG: endonuclease/exonuclease/phosphatase family protein [Paracoccaceae bacterium]|jgi:endonuclease/exonuclease/phosphatase family metal-dependent hydrolase|nr:endonuclease/exonuclease/phosphatase family protein [Paracoccaceae bacterium]